jgi:hypothetical protein
VTDWPMEPAEALLRAAAWLKRLRMPGVAPRQHAEDDEHLDQVPEAAA